jgi:hypothetical protein
LHTRPAITADTRRRRRTGTGSTATTTARTWGYVNSGPAVVALTSGTRTDRTGS